MKEEFVMVPRAELVRLQENMDPHRGAVAWGIVCDLLAKQSQGEPVAYTLTPPGCAAALVHAVDLTYRSEHAVPLYTHADPAEVEQLRAELVEWKERCQRNSDEAMSWMSKHDTLRAQAAQHKLAMDAACAQLAERDALLEDCLGPVQDAKNNADCTANERLYHNLGNAIRSALSASAEPSAPLYPKCTVLKGVPVRYSTSTAPVESKGTSKQIFSAHEFVLSYCLESGISEDDFYESEVPMPSQGSPHGWAAVSNHPLSIKAHVKIHLSGKAEAIEIDEQAVFESYILSRGVELPIGAELIDGLYCQGYPEMEDPADDQAFEALNSHWAAWQARAALERKP